MYGLSGFVHLLLYITHVLRWASQQKKPEGHETIYFSFWKITITSHEDPAKLSLMKTSRTDRHFFSVKRQETRIIHTKPPAILYANDKHTKKEISKTTPFHNSFNKYFRINLTNEVKDIYHENFKFLQK